MSDIVQPFESYAHLKQLNELANAGDLQAGCELREVLDNNPAIWQTAGDMAVQTEMTLIRRITGGDQLQTGAITRKMAAMKAELGIAGASIMERLAIERITSTWLESQYLDLCLASPDLASIKQGRYYSKRQDQAHRRHQAAIKSLATLKKLLPKPQQPGIDLTANQADEAPQPAAANTEPDNEIRLVG